MHRQGYSNRAAARSAVRNATREIRPNAPERSRPFPTDVESSGRILSEYTKRVLRRADSEHRPLQMEHASWYMAIVCSSALYELLGGEIYLAVSRCIFVHFILHIHLISHFCVPRLKFLEPKWSQIYS